MSERRVLVTGATGFLGRHVAEALRAAWPGRLRLLWHAREPDGCFDGTEWLRGDLRDAASLERACAGVTAIVHAACYIGDDAGACDAVNARGTEALVAAARRAGVSRLLYLSTTAVYGWAVHSGASETAVTVAPATPISRSRVAGEQAILSVGGIVLRPTFVYGQGDTRFVPAVIRAVCRFPFLVNGGRARLSVIDARDLARIVARATSRDGLLPGGAYHANDRRPIAFSDLVVALSRSLGTPIRRWSLPYAAARWALRLTSSGRWSPSAAHRLFLVTHDHHYDATRVWDRLGLEPCPPVDERLHALAGWYRRFVDEASASVA